MSGNENSEDENNNFLSKIKEIKERNLSISPAVRKSPQRQLYQNESELIKESTNEFDFEENSVLDGNNLKNNNSQKVKFTNEIRNNQIHSWNNNLKNNAGKSKKNLSVNKSSSNSNNNNNTEINNRRFEINPSDNKRNILANVNRNTPKDSRDVNKASEKRVSSKQFKSKSKLY